MKRQQVTQASLLPGVEVVPDAIIEIVTKQGEGCGIYQRGTSLIGKQATFNPDFNASCLNIS